MKGAIALTADASLDELDDTGRDPRAPLFLRLTQLGEGTEDTRRPARLERARFADASPSEIDDVLGRLVDARLVTVDDDRSRSRTKR